MNANQRKTNFYMLVAHIKTSSVQRLPIPEVTLKICVQLPSLQTLQKYEHETANDSWTLQKHEHELEKVRRKPRTAFV